MSADRTSGSNGGPRPATLSPVLTPLLEASGIDLEQIEVSMAGRRRVLRVIVDRDGGIDLDAVADVSRTISEALDADDIMGAVPYVLEVSSPGVDRPLTRPAHWRRAIGRLVRVELTGGDRLDGRVVGADDEGADLEETPGAARRIRYADVVGARVQVEFSRAAAGESEAELEDLEEFDDEGEEGQK